MSTINQATSYSEFIKKVLPNLKEAINNNKATIISFSYEGFSTSVMYQDFLKIVVAKSLTDENVINDLCQLLGLFHIRGPNVIEMKAENTKGDDEANRTIQDLVSRYELKAKNPKAKEFTLPRLSMVFAVLSYNIYLEILDILPNHPVSELELGLTGSQIFFPNFTSSMLATSDLKNDISGTIFFIHNLYQCILSKKTQITKKDKKNKAKMASVKTNLSDFIADASKFAHLACANTLTTPENIIKYKDSASLIIQPMIADGFTALKTTIKIHFSNVATEMIEPITKYHILYNKSVQRGVSFASMCENIHLSFAEMLNLN